VTDSRRPLSGNVLFDALTGQVLANGGYTISAGDRTIRGTRLDA